MIKVKKQISSDEVEILISDLYKNKLSEIQLPSSFEKQDFSQVPQIIQFISTALRLDQHKQLIINIEGLPSGEEASDIMNDPAIFAAFLFFWNNGILNSAKELIKKYLWDERDILLEAMQSFKYGKGNKSFAACLDHLPNNLGIVKSWYSGNDFISSERDLDAFLYKTLTKVGSFSSSYMKKSAGPIVEDLEIILFELLKNTDEHARTDEFGNILTPNIRGVYSTLHRNSKNDFLVKNKNNVGLRNYFDNVNIKENDFEQVIFLEISVFDSGPGLTTKYSKKALDTISIIEEVEYLKECLTKNKTSATGELKLKKGKGLDKVLRTLNNKGFIKIRSGRTCLFRDLVTVPYESVENAKEIKIFDWYTNSEKNFTALSWVSGTVFSMFYPIDSSNQIEVDSDNTQISLF
jgi:hypothetical protein